MIYFLIKISLRCSIKASVCNTMHFKNLWNICSEREFTSGISSSSQFDVIGELNRWRRIGRSKTLPHHDSFKIFWNVTRDETSLRLKTSETQIACDSREPNEPLCCVNILNCVTKAERKVAAFALAT